MDSDRQWVLVSTEAQTGVLASTLTSLTLCLGMEGGIYAWQPLDIHLANGGSLQAFGRKSCRHITRDVCKYTK